DLGQRERQGAGAVPRHLHLRPGDTAQRRRARDRAGGREVAMTPRDLTLERWALRYARIALGAAFLSGIASRFGLWGANVGYGNFANFVKATAEVNSFMPAFTIPFLAWAATIFELFFGLALIIGIWARWVSLGSALLLALFGIAMAISG